MNDRRLRDALARTRPPDEVEARERARAVARAAHEGMPARPRRRRLGVAVPVASAFTLVLVAGAVAATPPGAAVKNWVRDLVGGTQPPTPAPALSRLPSSGRLLVTGPAGAWIVHPDGSRRRLGGYTEATWSPNGLFVGAARERQLAALDPRGRVRWALSRPDLVHDPRWAPSGYRVAYRSGSDLRVVAGDGSGDRRIAARVRPVAPAWRPGRSRNELTYVDGDGRIVRRDTDSRRRLARRRSPVVPKQLQWSPSGGRLLITGERAIVLIGAAGKVQMTTRARAGTSFVDAKLSPDGRRVAVLRRSEASSRHDVLVVAAADGRARRLFTAAGPVRSLTWSPAGRLVLADWSGADQWLFLAIHPDAHTSAVAGIAGQFDPSLTRPGDIDVEGWCCR